MGMTFHILLSFTSNIMEGMNVSNIVSALFIDDNIGEILSYK
jgi:hypothetical protein